MKLVAGVRLGLDEPLKRAFERAVKKSGLRPREVSRCLLAKRSVDARDKGDVHFVCSVRIEQPGDAPPTPRDYKQVRAAERPVVVGFGPAGMFCALDLARHGLRPLVLERGSRVEERRRKVEASFAGAPVDPACNVQFGEGGAGTFSDGKLTTLIGDPLCEEVLADFADFGAPAEIRWQAKPHIGTDRLPEVVRRLREEIVRLGGEICFDTQATDFSYENGRLTAVIAGETVLETDTCVLAIGHSARDTYRTLLAQKVLVQPKAFSLGVRIEHLREDVDRAQYGKFAGHPALGAADYKLVYHDEQGNSAYTFCMCPGGSVVASSSEPDAVVTNGMSAFARDGVNSNSAVLVGVEACATPEQGIALQRELERRAFLLGNGRAPCQRVEDFLRGRPTAAFGRVQPTYRPGVTPSALSGLFGERVEKTLRGALLAWDRRMRGFAADDALLTAPETRSSAPLRILRNESYMSPSLRGLYPCGEGCGYAGGIMSAAVDGLRVSRAIVRRLTARTSD